MLLLEASGGGRPPAEGKEGEGEDGLGLCRSLGKQEGEFQTELEAGQAG